jgi:hypothetical protein
LLGEQRKTFALIELFRFCHPAAVALCPISDFQNFRLTAGANQHYSDLVPSLRGALRNVINAGRDAVDAVSALDERTAAYGEVVWF